jgi:alginate O-acetyltransferase complex protein AlgI
MYYFVSRSPYGRNLVALLGSVLFFAWGEPIFVFALFILTYIDYRVSLFLAPEAKTKQGIKKLVLTLVIVLNLSLLICSKYLNFITTVVSDLFGSWVHIEPTNLPLILGISFITFHKISYLIDSYKGRAIMTPTI